MFTDIFNKFSDKAPISIIFRATLERTINPDFINNLYDRVSQKQYTRKLIFSTIFELMNVVVCNIKPSINAAYKENKDNINSSLTAVYDKINGVEIETSQALVRETSIKMAEVVRSVNGKCKPWISGYRIKVMDGNCIEATEHRIDDLRNTKSGALPGKSLVIYEPELEMATDVFPVEDGHAQERSLLGEVLSTIRKNDVLVMDRNFAVRSFLAGISERQAYYIVRKHKGLAYTVSEKEKYAGKDKGNKIYEQLCTIKNDDGALVKVRRIRIELKESIRNGEKELVVFTNLSRSAAPAKLIAEIYRRRWSIETAFQELEAHLHSEINTLGYPKAALFGFCTALIAYNAMAIVKGALRRVYGEENIRENFSGFYMALHLQMSRTGIDMMIEESEWVIFKNMSACNFAEFILQLAEKVNLSKFQKSKQAKRKNKPKENKDDPYAGHPHVSTARLLRGITP